MNIDQKFFKKKLEYRYGFRSEIRSETFEKGLSEDIIKKISKEKKEPDFILEFRLDAYRKFKKMQEPSWGNLFFKKIDLQEISYFSKPKIKKNDPKVKKELNRLGVDIEKNFAIDIVFNSMSVGTTFQEELKKYGVILCSISEAIQKYPDIIKKYLATVVKSEDNFYSALNSAVFSDGSFVFVPEGVQCPVELSTYFRINEKNVGQFERTLIIAEKNSSLSYLEGCTASSFKEKQLHAAVVEIIALDNAYVKYSTIQNWYSGPPGGVYNFVTKRGRCLGENSRISWTQVEMGSKITWKYPSCILEGKNSKGEFYSVSITDKFMQTDTGTRMIHLGENSSSTILSKSIVLGRSRNTYRSMVKIFPEAKNSRNFSRCDSILIGKGGHSYSFPTIEGDSNLCSVEHEASIYKIDEDKIFYLQTRGIDKDKAINMIVNGFCCEVIEKIPYEFALEAKELLFLKLENLMG